MFPARVDRRTRRARTRSPISWTSRTALAGRTEKFRRTEAPRMVAQLNNSTSAADAVFAWPIAARRAARRSRWYKPACAHLMVSNKLKSIAPPGCRNSDIALDAIALIPGWRRGGHIRPSHHDHLIGQPSPPDRWFRCFPKHSRRPNITWSSPTSSTSRHRLGLSGMNRPPAHRHHPAPTDTSRRAAAAETRLVEPLLAPVPHPPFALTSHGSV